MDFEKRGVLRGEGEAVALFTFLLRSTLDLMLLLGGVAGRAARNED